jgi:MFS family permease
LSFAVPVPSDPAVRRLALARLISATGSVAANIALASVLYARTGSAAWVAAALFISFATPALFSPLAGTLGDRLDRRRLLIASDLFGAACFTAMALVTAPAALLAVAFPAALAAAPFLPASGAMVPALAPAERLTWANARLAVARNAGTLVGPVLGGVMVAVASGSAAFAVNAASFAVSAVLIATLRGSFRASQRAAERAPSRIGEGVRLVLREPTLRALTLGFVLVDFGTGMVMPADPALAHLFGTGSTGYGLMVALWGAGGVVASRFAGGVLDRRSEPAVIVASAGVLGLSFALTAVAPWFALALAALAAGGASMGMAGVAEDLLLQRRVADEVRGRVFAAHLAAVQLSLAVPLLFSGFVVNALGPRAVFGIAAGLAACGLLALTTLLRRRAATAAA